MLAGSKRDVKGEIEYLDSRGVMMRGTGSRMKSNNYPANWFVTLVKRTWPARVTRRDFAVKISGLSLSPSRLPTLNPSKSLGAYYEGIYATLGSDVQSDKHHGKLFSLPQLQSSLSSVDLFLSLREHSFLNDRSKAVSKILSYFV